jgi:hypothetical protein
MPFFPQRAIAIRGSYVGTLDELHEVVGLGREGRIPPIPLDVRPLDAAPEAMADLRAGHVRGRVILKPEGDPPSLSDGDAPDRRWRSHLRRRPPGLRRDNRPNNRRGRGPRHGAQRSYNHKEKGRHCIEYADGVQQERRWPLSPRNFEY